MAHSSRIARRQILKLGAAAASAVACGVPTEGATPQLPLYAELPRWRGFNLVEKFTLAGDRPYIERDFAFIAEHGFNFVRLPLDYRIWTDPDGDYRESRLREIDEAVAFGRKYDVHVCLNFHRAPGYCINPPMEPIDLWGDTRAQKLFAAQWRMFAKRYRGIPAEMLSFNLVNEPPNLTEAEYFGGIAPAVEAIHHEDSDRLVIADGRNGGRNPTPALARLKTAQAGRSYEPFRLTHYKAPWLAASDHFDVPAWPMAVPGEGTFDKDRLWREGIEPWTKLNAAGVGAMIGEWGCFNQTPHAVALAWMKDCLGNFRKAGLGWCLWNLRGPFGPVDSKRSDVDYENQDGMLIDTAMLSLLKRDA